MEIEKIISTVNSEQGQLKTKLQLTKHLEYLLNIENIEEEYNLYSKNNELIITIFLHLINDLYKNLNHFAYLEDYSFCITIRDVIDTIIDMWKSYFLIKNPTVSLQLRNYCNLLWEENNRL